MNPRYLEFALKKQQLQWQAASQRERLLHDLERLERIEQGFRRVGELAGWMRQHAPMVSVGALLLLLARPRLVLRLARRGWLGWMAYRRLRGLFDTLVSRA